MQPIKGTIIVIISVCFLCLSLLACKSEKPREKPLDEAPVVDFPAPTSQTIKTHLLTGDFRIITDVNGLPASVRKTFQEKGGLRFVLANPGERFNPSDVIWDASVPQMRLILAGVSKDKCFVHYERGGRGLSYVIEVFELQPNAEMRPLWRGYCRQPLSDFEKLRSQVEVGGCS